jgi:hypothetical protein
VFVSIHITLEQCCSVLTFLLPGAHLNFSTWFIENLSIIWAEKVKLWNDCCFVENKTEVMKHVLKMEWISFLPKYVKWIYGCVFVRASVYANAGLWKVSYNVKHSVCPECVRYSMSKYVVAVLSLFVPLKEKSQFFTKFFF